MRNTHLVLGSSSSQSVAPPRQDEAYLCRADVVWNAGDHCEAPGPDGLPHAAVVIDIKTVNARKVAVISFLDDVNGYKLQDIPVEDLLHVAGETPPFLRGA